MMRQKNIVLPLLTVVSQESKKLDLFAICSSTIVRVGFKLDQPKQKRCEKPGSNYDKDKDEYRA